MKTAVQCLKSAKITKFTPTQIIRWKEQLFEEVPEIFCRSNGNAQGKYLGVKPRIISDNGSQFISRDFKTFLGDKELTHVKTSVRYPQSNRKIESFYKTIKRECIRKKSILDLKDIRKIIDGYIEDYNGKRLHGSINYLTQGSIGGTKGTAITGTKRKTTTGAKEGNKGLLKMGKRMCIILFQRKRKEIAYGNLRFLQFRLTQYTGIRHLSSSQFL